jgi:hypothetical protein
MRTVYAQTLACVLAHQRASVLYEPSTWLSRNDFQGIPQEFHQEFRKNSQGIVSSDLFTGLSDLHAGFNGSVRTRRRI